MACTSKRGRKVKSVRRTKRAKKTRKVRKRKHESKGDRALARVMSKVSRGERLTEHDRAILSAVTDANTKTDDRDSGTSLEKIMRKVAQGKKLTKSEREILAAALDAVEKKKRKRKR